MSAGDGTTTATVIGLRSLARSKAVAAGLNPMDSSGVSISPSRPSSSISPRTRKRLRRTTKSLRWPDIGQWGRIHRPGNPRAMEKVGNEGVIPVEEAKSLETETRSSKACSSIAAISRLIHHHSRDDRRTRGSLYLIHEKKLSSSRRCCRSSKRLCRPANPC